MSYLLSELNARGVPPLLHDFEAADARETWNRRRAEIAAVWADIIGLMPGRPDPGVKVHAESKEQDHVRLHISYATGFGDRITAYLLIPGAAAAPERKHPAILAM